MSIRPAPVIFGGFRPCPQILGFAEAVGALTVKGGTGDASITFGRNGLGAFAGILTYYPPQSKQHTFDAGGPAFAAFWTGRATPRKL